MAVDDGVDALDRSRLADRGRIGQARTTVIPVHDRQVTSRHGVADMHDPVRSKDHECVAAGVRRSEVAQIDLIFSAANRPRVCEGSRRQTAAPVLLEDALLLRGLQAVYGVRLLHVLLRIFLGDHVHRRGEFDVAAHVIAVRMGVDDRRHRFIGQRLDLVEDWLAPSWILRVDYHDALVGDEHGGIAATVFQYVEVVLYFVDGDGLLGRLRRLLKRRYGYGHG